jgi:hypothetical protein
MFSLLLLVNFASIIAFATGLINPKLVLRGEKRTRRKSTEIYLSAFVLSFIGMLVFVPKPEPVVIAPVAKLKAETKPASMQKTKASPSTQTQEVTPTSTPIPTEPIEIEPPKEESNTTTHSDGSYTKQTVETRKFQNHNRATYLLIRKTEKNVERGKITTKVETQIQYENSEPRATELIVTTQTDQGTHIVTEKIAENGVIDKQETRNDNIPQEVWDSFKIAEQDPMQSEGATQNSASIPTDGNCQSFATQADAQAALPANPQLDRDGNGTACDSVLSGGGGSYLHYRSSGSSDHYTKRRRRRR